MSTDTTFIDLLEGYLDDFDGPTPMPDHVRDAIHAALPRTAQARPVPVIGRVINMSGSSTALRWAIAAALVVTAIVVGGALMSTGGGVTPATASPTVSPSSTSSAPPSAPSPAASTAFVRLALAPAAACFPGDKATGCMAAGAYTMSTSLWPTTIGLTVPAGWFQYGPGADFEGVLVDGGADAPDGSGWGVLFMTVGKVAKDPCDRSRGTTDLTSSATSDALIAAMRAWPGFVVSEPTPVVMDGEEGQLVEVTSALTGAACPTSQIWTTLMGASVDAYPLAMNEAGPRPYTDQVRIFEFDGELVVIRSPDYLQTSPFEIQQGVGMDPTRHADDQVDLQQILDSVTFTANAGS